MTAHASDRAAHRTEIDVDPVLPTIRIVREFDAPRERVYRAWTDPDVVVRWLGPHSTTMHLEHWDVSTGGSYRYRHTREEDHLDAGFYGSFHEVRPGERIVQTFTWDGYPDGVSLETLTFENLPDERTRVTILSVVPSLQERDAIIASGMEAGVNDGFEKLDSILGSGGQSRG